MDGSLCKVRCLPAGVDFVSGSLLGVAVEQVVALIPLSGNGPTDIPLGAIFAHAEPSLGALCEPDKIPSGRMESKVGFVAWAAPEDDSHPDCPTYFRGPMLIPFTELIPENEERLPVTDVTQEPGFNIRSNLPAMKRAVEGMLSLVGAESVQVSTTEVPYLPRTRF